MKTKQNAIIDINQLDKSMFEIVGTNIEAAERISTKPYSYWKSVFLRILKNPTFIISFTLLVVVVAMACSIGIGAYAVPVDSSFLNRNQAPSAEHWFGTGGFGEDLWTKVWIGTRTTLLFTLIVASIQICLGIIIGSIWGFYSRLDIMFIEITRFITLIPSLILWLVVIFLFGGNKSIAVITFAISITSWVGLASLIRVQIMLTKNTEYNIASKVLGTPGHKIIRKNIMPKILPIIIQTSSFAIPNAIAIDSLLAYYGFGFIAATSNKEASLGSILNELLSNTDWQTPGQRHLFVVPIAMVAGISLIFFLAGKVFADSLDPKTHR
ncbi:oligopeptide ABC transporter permease [Spiroplasma clarkii]|uniref:Oligopeptide ABC transporter permease n=1 Tax=Spiroplasma clarkii TaxID=2139 RepID=A0A1Y0L0A9_9MOLU|nr:oligopeptide ABC transporter permease OppC [Spiroplasma clarkii]ARU91411.1 oligopeptide ABC transporter permease [Spiroplasma clarkii]ATX70827.1 oligopeptide ABC transporter permease [Spiroplasma clarkii]